MHSQAASVTPADKPTLQGQVDYMTNLARRLDKTLHGLNIALDRLASRPPQAVPDGQAGGVAGEAPRPSIEGALNVHNAHLEQLVHDAEALLVRVNKAV